MAIGDAVQIVTSSSPVDNVLQLLNTFGFFRVVIPFLLIFSIVYGLLLKTGVLGSVIAGDEASKKTARMVGAVVALATSFFVIGYSPVVDALATLIPQVSFLLVVVLILMMLLAMFGVDFNWTAAPWKDNLRWMAIIIVPIIVIMLAVVGASTGTAIPWLGSLTQFLVGAGAASGPMDPALVSTLLGLGIVIGIPLVVIGAVVYYGTRP